MIDLFQRRSRSGNTSPDLVGGSRVGVNSLITEARLMALDPGPISFASQANDVDLPLSGAVLQRCCAVATMDVI